MGLESVEGYHISVVKARLLPDAHTEQTLRSYTGAVRATYNKLLYEAQQVQDEYDRLKAQGVPKDQLPELIPVFNEYDLRKYIAATKHDLFDWADLVSAHVFIHAAKELCAAYKGWKRGGYKGKGTRNGYPRYREKHKELTAGKLSVSFVLHGKTWLSRDGSRIDIPVPTAVKKDMYGLNSKQQVSIRVAKDRRVTRAAKLVHNGRATVQEVTFSYKGGFWWAAIRLRVQDAYRTQYPRPAAPADAGLPAASVPDGTKPLRVIGIDASLGRNKWGRTSAPVPGFTDENNTLTLPQHMRDTHDKLRRAQRWYSRTTPGSKRHRKTLRKVQRLNHTLTEQRRTWQNQLSTTLLQHYEVICVEDLAAAGMARRKPGRKLSFGATTGSYGHSQFREMLVRKQHRYGGATTVVVADRYYPSSKTCSSCGSVKTKLSLGERTYRCWADQVGCGVSLDRDTNAALNLAEYGRQAVLTAQASDSNTSSTSSALGLSGSEATPGNLGVGLPKQVDSPHTSTQPVCAGDGHAHYTPAGCVVHSNGT